MSDSAQEPTRRDRRRLLGGMALAGAALPLATLLPQGAAHAVAMAPLGVRGRSNASLGLRLSNAQRNAAVTVFEHAVNRDDEVIPSLSGNFSKALRHNALGEVERDSYLSLIGPLSSGRSADYAAVQLGGPVKLANPQAALAFQLEGADSNALAMPAPPGFLSERIAGEMAEVYWHALLRDVHFAEYATSPLAQAAVTDLQKFEGFTQTSLTNLFRGDTVGDLVGPYLSQFLWLDVPYGAHSIVQRYNVPVADEDFMTGYAEWLAIQNGQLPTRSLRLDTTPRYLRNGRDLGEYVHRDFTYQAFINAALILLSFGGGALDDANPYKSSSNQGGFVTLGASDILATVAKAADYGLRAAWFQKWQVHRRVRPEEFAGRVENERLGTARYGIHPKLAASEAYQRIVAKHGTALLPMAFAEGCPTHPAYPAGHATISGACATVLKAFFKESFVLPTVRQSNADGTALVPLDAQLTVGGELDKLAANISLGRDIAGVHWRSDGIEGLKLGEQVGIALLRDLKGTYNESFAGFELKRFDGSLVRI